MAPAATLRKAGGAPAGSLRAAVRPAQSRARENIQHSLFGEILDWMLAPLLLLWPMSIAITYLVAKSIANQPFDHALEDSVTVLAQQVKEVDGKVSARLPGSARDILRADDVDSVYFQISGTARRARRRRPRTAAAAARTTPSAADGPLPQRQPARHPVRVAYAWVNLEGAAEPANRAWRWCRWPKRWTSAPSSPTRSSRA
jgi:two-component system sensor histidine kinase TctE